jgi:hypothetical protein
MTKGYVSADSQVYETSRPIEQYVHNSRQAGAPVSPDKPGILLHEGISPRRLPEDSL